MAQGGFGRPGARDKLMIGFLPRTEAVFQYKHCSATGWLYWLYKGGCRGGLLFLVAARQYLANLSIVISGVRRRHQGRLAVYSLSLGPSRIAWRRRCLAWADRSVADGRLRL